MNLSEWEQGWLEGKQDMQEKVLSVLDVWEGKVHRNPSDDPQEDEDVLWALEIIRREVENLA